jgi:hypothetical protein
MKKSDSKQRKALKALLSGAVTPRQLERALNGRDVEILCRIGDEYTLNGQRVSKEVWDEARADAKEYKDCKLITVNLPNLEAPKKLQTPDPEGPIAG